MLRQLTASYATTASAAAPEGTGMVLSIDAARRRRSHGTAARDLVRVVVMSGHALTRAGLRRLLEDDDGLAVVGDAATSADAAPLVRRTRPDVVLLDADRGELDLAAATRALGGLAPVLLLASSVAEDLLLAALQAGVTGVLPKDSRPAELASAVRTLAAGGALLPPHTARRLITELVNATSNID